MTHNSYYPMSFPPKENFLDETLTVYLEWEGLDTHLYSSCYTCTSYRQLQVGCPVEVDC